MSPNSTPPVETVASDSTPARFFPQPYPLYAVTSAGTLTLVMGWASGRPYLQPIGRNIDGPARHYEGTYQLYTDLDDARAECHHIWSLAAQAKRAKESGLPDALDSFWDKKSAGIKAAVTAAVEAGKPLTSDQWAELYGREEVKA